MMGNDDLVVTLNRSQSLRDALPHAKHIRNAVVGNEFGHLWWEFGPMELWAQSIAAFLNQDTR